MYELPAETIKAVDGFPVPAGFWREGTREASFMYLIGVHVETIDEKTRALLIIQSVSHLLNSIDYIFRQRSKMRKVLRV